MPDLKASFLLQFGLSLDVLKPAWLSTRNIPRGICLFDEWFPHCWGIYTPKNESIETENVTHIWGGPRDGMSWALCRLLKWGQGSMTSCDAWAIVMNEFSHCHVSCAWQNRAREAIRVMGGAWRAFDCSTVQFFSLFFIDFSLFFLTLGLTQCALPLTVCFSTSEHLRMVGMSYHLLHGCYHVSGRWYLLTIAFSLLSQSALEPSTALQDATATMSWMWDETSIYFPTIVCHLGSISLQVKKTKTQRGKRVTQSNRVGIQVLRPLLFPPVIPSWSLWV